MRALRQMMAGVAFVSVLAAAAMFPVAGAAASRRPLDEQWWFAAWRVTSGIWPITQGRGVTVGVIDSGVQASIPDLAGVVLRGADTTNGTGDGRKDIESPGHGTGMATVIAGQGTRTGYLGIAPKVKILPVIGKTNDGITRGIRYATSRGANIINISQVAPLACGTEMQQAIIDAIRQDVIIVAGAGNDGDGHNWANSPASCRGVLAVGAVDNHLRAWSKTQRQPYVAVAAPGVAMSAVLKDGRDHTTEGGTSMASALTSAGIALLRSRWPTESRTDILKRVFASLRDAETPGKDDATGYGVFRPVEVLEGPVPDPAAYERWAHSNGQIIVGPSGSPSARAQGRSSRSVGASVRSLIMAVALFVVVAVGVLVLALVARTRRSRRRPRPGSPYQPGPPYLPGPPHHPGPAPHEQRSRPDRFAGD